MKYDKFTAQVNRMLFFGMDNFFSGILHNNDLSVLFFWDDDLSMLWNQIFQSENNIMYISWSLQNVKYHISCQANI